MDEGKRDELLEWAEGASNVAEFEIVEKEIDHDREVQWAKGSKRNTYSGVSRGLYRYVLKCYLIHRESGAIIGTGVGSCSTLESKYIDRPRDLENTVFKMAKKRAYVDATLTAYGLSDEFTQDVEDMPREMFETEYAESSRPAREATPPFDEAAAVAELNALVRDAEPSEAWRRWYAETCEAGLDARKVAAIREQLQERIEKRRARAAAAAEEPAAEAAPAPAEAPKKTPLERINARYFALLAERHPGLSDADRRAFQEATVGKASCKDFDANDYERAIAAVEAGEVERHVIPF
jgi:hypothetical protein